MSHRFTVAEEEDMEVNMIQRITASNLVVACSNQSSEWTGKPFAASPLIGRGSLPRPFL